MKFVALFAAFAPLVPTFASPTSNGYVHPANGKCVDYTVKEPISFTEAIYGDKPFKSNFDVSVFLFNLARKDHDSYQPISGYKNVTKTYEIAATFCSPKTPKGGKENTVLLATHGGGYDSRYWTSTYKPDEYNFVQHALNAGYSVFYYDRLGTGQSEIVSGYEAQGQNQLEILATIAKAIRAGKYTSDIKLGNLVLVGHSFGSAFTHGVISKYPDLAEGVVLTGFAYPNSTDVASYTSAWTSSAFGGRLATTVDPPFKRDSGYLSFVDIYSHAETFFHEPYDLPTVYYAQSIAQPTAAMEFITGFDVVQDASSYTGKLFLTTGEFDLLICGGECHSSYQYGLQHDLWAGVQNIEMYLHPNAGHGINFAHNATGFYSEIVGFLDRNF